MTAVDGLYQEDVAVAPVVPKPEEASAQALSVQRYIFFIVWMYKLQNGCKLMPMMHVASSCCSRWAMGSKRYSFCLGFNST